MNEVVSPRHDKINRMMLIVKKARPKNALFLCKIRKEGRCEKRRRGTGEQVGSVAQAAVRLSSCMFEQSVNPVEGEMGGATTRRNPEKAWL